MRAVKGSRQRMHMVTILSRTHWGARRPSSSDCSCGIGRVGQGLDPSPACALRMAHLLSVGGLCAKLMGIFSENQGSISAGSANHFTGSKPGPSEARDSAEPPASRGCRSALRDWLAALNLLLSTPKLPHRPTPRVLHREPPQESVPGWRNLCPIPNSTGDPCCMPPPGSPCWPVLSKVGFHLPLALGGCPQAPGPQP